MSRAQPQSLRGERFIIMHRLLWLAPLKAADGAMDLNGLLAALDEQMAKVSAPVMVAVMREEGGWLVEERRGFVVPEDWSAQSARRRQDGTLPT